METTQSKANYLLILFRIGEGGSGFVYKAKWNADIVALKELRSMHLLEAEKEEFRREALLMR